MFGMYLCICTTHMSGTNEGVKFTGNGVTGGYECLDQTNEPWKSSKCSYLTEPSLKTSRNK